MGVEPVVFYNRDGLRIFGMLHLSEASRRNACVLMLNPGSKSRVAPHRLYVKMAERFCGMGFCVFRFDSAGIGDSEGEIDGELSADLYASVQMGRFVNDALDAMNWMGSKFGFSRFILSGLCGGAITGLLAGAQDERVDSLIGLGIPVIIDGSGARRQKYMTRGQLSCIRSSYFRKLLHPESWKRLLSFQSDFRLILRSIQSSSSKVDNRPSKSEPNGNSESESNLNPFFKEAFHRMISSRKVLLIFSECDRLYYEFEEKYATPHKREFKKHKHNVRIQIIKEANHIFSFKKWQDEMMAACCSWLNEFH